MATGTFYFFAKGIQYQYDGTAVVDLNSDTIKCALTTSTYTPGQETHDYFNDVTNEVTGAGYSAGGATCNNVTVTLDTANNKVTFSCDDVTWSNSTITARTAVFYKSTGTAATSPLIGYVTFDADVSTTAGLFTIDIGANGLAAATYGVA